MTTMYYVPMLSVLVAPLKGERQEFVRGFGSSCIWQNRWKGCNDLTKDLPYTILPVEVCWCQISNAQMKDESYWKVEAAGIMCKDNSQFISASSSFTWKNVFSLMLKVLELILQLQYLLDQTIWWNICWCHCLRIYRKWRGWFNSSTLGR